MAEPPKYSTSWCMINPGQAAADFDRLTKEWRIMHTALEEIEMMHSGEDILPDSEFVSEAARIVSEAMNRVQQ